MNAAWKPWPIRNHHDAIAYAQDWKEIIPPETKLSGSEGEREDALVARRIGAARIAKLLSYLIHDLGAMAGKGILQIAVDTRVTSDYLAHTWDGDLVAKVLGLDGLEFSPLHPDEPFDAILKLGTRLTEDTSVIALAARRGVPFFGLNSTRLNAGLQSLLFTFYGYGHPTELSCALGGPIEYRRNDYNTMAFGYFVGPMPSSHSSHALITVEGQIDEHTQGPNRYHPLAGAIVSLDSHSIAIGSRGICLDLASGRLGYVKPLGDGRYSLKLFHKECPWGHSNISVASAISWGAGPQGNMIDRCYLSNFRHEDPSSLDGDLVVSDSVPTDLMKSGYPHRHLCDPFFAG